MKTPDTKDKKPDRKHLGPTGPEHLTPDRKKAHTKRVHPGNVTEKDAPIVGPTPTGSPHGQDEELAAEIEKRKREHEGESGGS